MPRPERRSRGRIACTTLARFVLDGQPRAALVADLSLDGVRLRGADLPPAGTVLEIALVAAPPFAVRARVAWRDVARGEAGLEIVRDGPLAPAISRGLLALAFEAESDRPAAAVLVDDLELAAHLCASVRRSGFIPRAFRTPLDAVAALERARPPILAAIVSPTVWESPGEEVLALLAARYPATARIALGWETPAADLALPCDDAERGLDEALASWRRRAPHRPVDPRRRDTRRTRVFARSPEDPE